MISHEPRRPSDTHSKEAGQRTRWHDYHAGGMNAWPAMMLRKTAAAYCDLSEAAFEREVNAGRLAAPVMFGGRQHWHRVSLDKDLERIAGVMRDWREDSKLYGT